MLKTSSDVIVKEVLVRSSRSKVWRALTDFHEFSKWFQVEMHDPFVPGSRSRGKVTYPGKEDLTMEIVIEKMEPERLFSWRWHPDANDPQRDYSGEPTTLVEFELEEVAEGTKIRVTESGFDAIPFERRAASIRSNTRGWEGQMEALRRYVE
jgi:uncharacterized protein YndB with AHSA1/START domain